MLLTLSFFFHRPVLRIEYGNHAPTGSVGNVGSVLGHPHAVLLLPLGRVRISTLRRPLPPSHTKLVRAVLRGSSGWFSILTMHHLRLICVQVLHRHS